MHIYVFTALESDRMMETSVKRGLTPASQSALTLGRQAQLPDQSQQGCARGGRGLSAGVAVFWIERSEREREERQLHPILLRVSLTAAPHASVCVRVYVCVFMYAGSSCIAPSSSSSSSCVRSEFTALAHDPAHLLPW